MTQDHCQAVSQLGVADGFGQRGRPFGMRCLVSLPARADGRQQDQADGGEGRVGLDGPCHGSAIQIGEMSIEDGHRIGIGVLMRRAQAVEGAGTVCDTIHAHSHGTELRLEYHTTGGMVVHTEHTHILQGGQVHPPLIGRGKPLA